MAGQGLDRIPLRIPEEWSAGWFESFVRDVLSQADVRNAVEGTGISIAGTSDGPATLAASDEVLALLTASLITATPAPLLPQSRVLAAGNGITITDGGAGEAITISARAPFWYDIVGIPIYVESPNSPAWDYRIDGSVVGYTGVAGANDGIAEGSLAGDLVITPISGRVFTNAPVIVENNAGLLISNDHDQGAGLEFTTSGADEFGINSQLAHWETSDKLYGFRWLADGSPANQAYLELYRHDNSAGGARVLRITRTTGVIDVDSKIQLADGALGTPTLTFTSDDDLGLFRLGADQLGIGAAIVRINSAASDTAIEVQNTLTTGFSVIALLNSSGTRVVNFGYGNGSSSLPNTPFLNMPTSLDFLFRTAGVERWRLLGAGNFRAVDGIELVLGTGNDLRLYHDGTNSIIANATGRLDIQEDLLRVTSNAAETALEVINTTAAGFEFLSFLNSSGARSLNFGMGNASASLPHGFLNMATGLDFLLRTSGAERWRMFGATGHLRSADSIELQLGAGPDLRLFHNGTDSTIRNDTGNLLFLAGATEAFRITSAALVTFATKVTTVASASAAAGFRLPHGAAPSAPADGDMWTTTAGLFVRINGVTVGPLS